MNSGVITIHGDEWKKEHIDEPVEWAKTKTWLKKMWSSDADNWEHDHCQVCWWKLYKSEEPEHGIGYHNSENDNWLCSECYEQFVAE